MVRTMLNSLVLVFFFESVRLSWYPHALVPNGNLFDRHTGIPRLGELFIFSPACSYLSESSRGLMRSPPMWLEASIIRKSAEVWVRMFSQAHLLAPAQLETWLRLPESTQQSIWDKVMLTLPKFSTTLGQWSNGVLTHYPKACCQRIKTYICTVHFTARHGRREVILFKFFLVNFFPFFLVVFGLYPW